MTTLIRCSNSIVAAIALLVCYSGPGQADALDDLLTELRSATPETAPYIEGQITTMWSDSGSPAMDQLLRRGRQAIEAGEFDLAIGHLTALTDHTPDFAEGFAARALAFYESGEVGLAMADLRQALVIEPRHFGALQGVAAILEELGYSDAALTAWRQVLELYPQLPEAQQARDRLSIQIEGQPV